MRRKLTVPLAEWVDAPSTGSGADETIGVRRTEEIRKLTVDGHTVIIYYHSLLVALAILASLHENSCYLVNKKDIASHWQGECVDFYFRFN